jgi:LmbE family N-acetylglucosaminyl deacetylase
MNLFIAPHNDDETLFGAFTIMREKCPVVIVTDSWLQFNRGQAVTANQRWAESCASADILRCPIYRLGIRDDCLWEPQLIEALRKFECFDKVYAPAIQGGNIQHDITNRAAHAIWGDNVIEYTTYTKTELWTKGNVEIKPTPEEIARKNEALMCHESQFIINRPHFDAVFGRSEWLM